VAPLNLINIDLPGDMAGAVPLGPKGYFDPLGLSDTASAANVKRWRESELKHGRLAMLATLAFLVQEKASPLFPSDAVTGPAIYHWQQVAGNILPEMTVLLVSGIAIAESVSIAKGWESASERRASEGSKYLSNLKDDYIPGDLGFDPFGLNPDRRNGKTSTFNAMTPEFANMRAKELNNGRLAMVGIAGMVSQELVDMRGIAEHFSAFGLAPGGPK
jgi:hypothetical protein